MELQKSETREDLLSNTIKHFNSNNRGVDEVESCTFINQETGSRCAIGRELPEELAIDLADNFNGLVGSYSVFTKLPERLKEMGADFLGEIQYLHDLDGNWDEDGLSMEGLRFVDNIRMIFNID